MFLSKTPRREKGKLLVNFDYQNVNSLCSRHHYVNSALWSFHLFHISDTKKQLNNHAQLCASQMVHKTVQKARVPVLSLSLAAALAKGYFFDKTLLHIVENKNTRRQLNLLFIFYEDSVSKAFVRLECGLICKLGTPDRGRFGGNSEESPQYTFDSCVKAKSTILQYRWNYTRPH